MPRGIGYAVGLQSFCSASLSLQRPVMDAGFVSFSLGKPRTAVWFRDQDIPFRWAVCGRTIERLKLICRVSRVGRGAE